jgi:hypothetical protein
MHADVATEPVPIGAIDRLRAYLRRGYGDLSAGLRERGRVGVAGAVGVAGVAGRRAWRARALSGGRNAGDTFSLSSVQPAFEAATDFPPAGLVMAQPPFSAPCRRTFPSRI